MLMLMPEAHCVMRGVFYCYYYYCNHQCYPRADIGDGTCLVRYTAAASSHRTPSLSHRSHSSTSTGTGTAATAAATTSASGAYDPQGAVPEEEEVAAKRVLLGGSAGDSGHSFASRARRSLTRTMLSLGAEGGAYDDDDDEVTVMFKLLQLLLYCTWSGVYDDLAQTSRTGRVSVCGVVCSASLLVAVCHCAYKSYARSRRLCS
jgi:hypothetical protein